MGIAAVGKVGLISSDSAKLDSMIDATKAGKKGSAFQLKSSTAFGKGRHFYMDYDILAIMKSMFSSLPDDQPEAAMMKVI